MNQYERLRKQVERQARRMKQADRDRPTLLAQTAYISILGLLFVLLAVSGAATPAFAVASSNFQSPRLR